MLGQPRHPIGLSGHVEHLEGEALSFQRPPLDREICPELACDVVDDPVVCRRSRAEHGHGGRKGLHHLGQPAIVGTKVVSPVGDAVDLVDDEQPHVVHEARERLLEESLVVEAFR